MRLIIQRVSKAAVEVAGEPIAQIGPGLLLLLGIEADDTAEDIEWLCRKVVAIRIFSDQNGQMNLSVQEIGGQLLVVSQFTLFASTKKGNRPSFIRAARPDFAVPMYEQFVQTLRQESGLPVSTGIFGADMQVSLVNDGPVTIMVDTKLKE